MSSRSISVEPKKCISVADRFKDLEEKASSAQKSTNIPPIGKAFMLRDSNVKYFEPRIVAIGPVHHYNDKYKVAEEFKSILATKFIIQSGCSREILFETIKNRINPLKSRYMEEVRKQYNNDDDDDELAWMLFVDGCAVLQFIRSAVDETLKEMLKNDLAAFAAHDIFLLENQLPFEALQLLMNKHKDCRVFSRSIQDFIDTNMVVKPEEELKLSPQPIHLLDLLRTRLLQRPQPTNSEIAKAIPGDCPKDQKRDDQGNKTTKGAGTPSNKKYSSGEGSSSHKIESLCPQSTNKQTSITISDEGPKEQKKDFQGHMTTKACGTESSKSGSSGAGAPTQKSNSSGSGTLSRDWQTFRNIMELKGAGIDLNPSKTSCLKDFSFEEGYLWHDTVKLPSIRVDDSTAPKFLNMIAYEMLPEFKNEGEVSSYICLMDSLIDHPDDVKELRKANILHNMLGSDQEVSDLFNAISTDLVPNPYAYSDFKRKIQTHYDTEWKTSVAQGFHDHFSTPWTRIALTGALFGLILSFIQTLCGFLK